MTRIETWMASRLSPVAPVGRPAAAPFDAVLAEVQLEAAREAASGRPTEAAMRVWQYMAFGTRQGSPTPVVMPAPGSTGRPAAAVATAPLPTAPTAAAAPGSPKPAGSAQARFLQLKPLFQQAEQTTGVPWQIQAAQWAVETGWGAATPKDRITGQESHNLFGVKGQGSQGSVQAATTEVENGRTVQTVAGFRAYSSLAESVLDHARLLASPYYASAQAAGQDLRAWTEQLGPQHLGYATDPQYGQKLWQIITQNGWDK
ncbi:MAG: muramidase [Firmicutes bacterium]|nr:muramidase [Bacillota bacterium]